MKSFIICSTWIFSVVLLSGCIKEESPIDSNKSEKLNISSGRNDLTIDVDGFTREFIVHVPMVYHEEQAVPLLFMLHGSSGTGEKFWNISGWKEKAEEEGFIAVFPTAREYPIAEKNGRLSTKWASEGIEYVAVPGTEIIDDIPFFYAMINLLEQNLVLDDSRYYISGFSNGGGFVKSKVLVEMTDVFAAFSSAGGLGLSQFFEPTANFYPPLYNMVGREDEKVLENAAIQNELPMHADVLFQNETIDQNVGNILQMLKLRNSYFEVPMIPATNEVVFKQSLTSQTNEYRLLIINDMGHNYPNGKNNPHKIKATDILWPWFMSYQKS